MNPTNQIPEADTMKKFSDMSEMLQAQQKQLNATIADYVSFVLRNDPVYEAMMAAAIKPQGAINEIDSRVMI